MLEEFELQRERLAIEAEIGGIDAHDRRVPDIGPDQPLGGGDVLAVDRGRRGCHGHPPIIKLVIPAKAGIHVKTKIIGRPVAERGRRRLKAGGSPTGAFVMAEAEGDATMAGERSMRPGSVPAAGAEGAPRLEGGAAGGMLEVLATDPGATKDFEHFCRTTGCDLVEASEQPGGILRFRLRKPG